jgi:GTP:adenosylcobinamide-phosphate guanylyltransferase
MTIQADVRAPLATALSGLVASVYEVVPEVMTSPAVIISPDSPYLEPNIINQSTTKVQINMIVTAAVGYQNNAGALDNLEQLVISILGAMPSGYVVGDVQRPSVLEAQTGKYLVADIPVHTQYTE